jgi:hypothetical protein
MSLAGRITTEFLNDAARTKALAGDALTAFGEAFARAFSSVVIDVTSPDFGAGPHKTGAENRVAFQAAVDYAYSIYFLLGQVVTVYVPPGLYPVELDSAEWWGVPFDGGAFEFHGGVKLRSGVYVRGEPGGGTVITPVAFAGAVSGSYYAIFSRWEESGTLTDAIDLQRVGFEDINFEFGEAWPATHGAVYGVMAVGIDGFKLLNCRAELTGGTAGSVARGARLMNCVNSVVDGLEALNIAQAMYVSYCGGMFIRGRAKGTHEGIDWDQTSSRVMCWFDMSDGTGSEQQALDISSVTDSCFWLTGQNFGNCAVIYSKPNCHPTFTDWLANHPTATPATAPVHPARIYFHARCSNVQSASSRSLQVSLRRDDSFGVGYWDGTGLARDITLDVALIDSNPVIVNECDNIQGSVTIRGCVVGATPAPAVLLRSEHLEGLAESKLSGKLLITLYDCQYGGVRVFAPTDLDLSGSSVQGYNSEADADGNYGFFFDRLTVKPGRLTIGDLTVSGGDLTVQPNDIKISYVSATSPIGAATIVDRGGHRLLSGATTPVSAANGGAAYSRVKEYFVPVALDTVANSAQTVPIGSVADGGRLLAAHVANYAAVPQGGGAGANHTALSMRRVRAGVLSSAIGTAAAYDSVARSAGAVVDLTVDGSDVDGLYQAGDFVALQATRVGTGSVLAGQNLFVRYALLEWSTS